MSHLRFNVITHDWIIMADDRADKPNDFATPAPAAALPEHRADCPFCPGNEHLTTPELDRVGESGAPWSIRVVSNKYPALSPDTDLHRESEGTFQCMRAAGNHEVIIENPLHNSSLATYDRDHLASLLRIYRRRYTVLRQSEHIESITLFRNHGVRAGTSLEHPHSQVIAAPVVPPQVRMRIEEAIRHHDTTGECIFCRVLADELAAGDRILDASHHFVAFVPYAAISPYHQWIFPRRHDSSFDTITDAEIDDLAKVVSTMARRMRHGLGAPDFNFAIRSAPTGESATKYYHWYITIIPRITRAAGFELGSGMFINAVLPERAAEHLRDSPTE